MAWNKQCIHCHPASRVLRFSLHILYVSKFRVIFWSLLLHSLSTRRTFPEAPKCFWRLNLQFGIDLYDALKLSSVDMFLMWKRRDVMWWGDVPHLQAPASFFSQISRVNIFALLNSHCPKVPLGAPQIPTCLDGQFVNWSHFLPVL